MGRLIYLMLLSLDGYIEDSTGSFDWSRTPRSTPSSMTPNALVR
jgi:hypothetical protein